MRVLIVTLLAAVSITSAWDEIRIDFGDDSPNPTGNWNFVHSINSATYSNLIDWGTGEPSAISLTVGSGWSNLLPSNWSGGNIDWVDGNAASDCMYSALNNITSSLVILGGLDPTEKYILEIVSAYNNDDNPRLNNITVNGSKTLIGYQSDAVDSSQWDVTDAADGNWLIWDKISSDGDGDMILSFGESGTDRLVFVNAIRLTPVPEPATFVLFFVGGLVARRQMAG
jgi:hypothetical protein